ncbi:MAG: DUF2345 domain-containing protein, partial [Rhodoferax sp.]|uniref:DUF2345 domain-containing protein n=1 Tax=Rhodoferax sp. TaxID=50421 RepID=UPI0032637D93
ANGHIDWAAAKKISISTAGGANITIEGGNITTQAPGQITVHAGQKVFEGPGRINPSMPSFPKGSFVVPMNLTFDNSPMGMNTAWAGMPYKVYANGAVVKQGVMDETGAIELMHSPAIQHYQVELSNGMKYEIPVVDGFRSPEEGPLAAKGIFKGEDKQSSKASRTEYHDALKAAVNS